MDMDPYGLAEIRIVSYKSTGPIFRVCSSELPILTPHKVSHSIIQYCPWSKFLASLYAEPNQVTRLRVVLSIITLSIDCTSSTGSILETH